MKTIFQLWSEFRHVQILKKNVESVNYASGLILLRTSYLTNVTTVSFMPMWLYRTVSVFLCVSAILAFIKILWSVHTIWSVDLLLCFFLMTTAKNFDTKRGPIQWPQGSTLSFCLRIVWYLWVVVVFDVLSRCTSYSVLRSLYSCELWPFYSFIRSWNFVKPSYIHFWWRPDSLVVDALTYVIFPRVRKRYSCVHYYHPI